jgi:uncharacterized protein (TIGR02453 family)
MVATRSSFEPALFDFLRDLRQNNRREWFQANKERYEEHLKDPALQFISDFGPELAKISPHFAADPRPVGGSLFRIYHDVRFSRDKNPYKTHTGIQFRHKQAKDVHAPGFYLHLEPGNVFTGVGIWRPTGETMKMVRDAIVSDPGRWQQVTGRKAFRSRWQAEGESLKRPPKGYDPEHPLIEDLKRKDFTFFTRLEEDDVTAPGFLKHYARLCKGGAPVVEFLCQAVGIPF